MALRVDKWQQGRPQWHYDPVMQGWFRFIQTAIQDALQVAGDKPTDEAILARDWIARSEPGVAINGKREFVSFGECCHWLGLNAEAEMVALLAFIDSKVDFDTDECDTRLDYLLGSEPEEVGSLFEVPAIFRVVPVRDQGSLFAA
jgi:hypothetical protein